MNNRTYNTNGSVVNFYSEGDLVGSIDYSDKSDSYIEDACDNWLNMIMTVETVERYSTLKNGITSL